MSNLWLNLRLWWFHLQIKPDRWWISLSFNKYHWGRLGWNPKRWITLYQLERRGLLVILLAVAVIILIYLAIR